LLDTILSCKPIRCDTTQLKTGGQFNSKRTDKFEGARILTFEQKVSFACKEGYEIEDKESFDPSSDDQICDRYWQSNYEPEHNSECKAIKCTTNSIVLKAGQIVVDELDQPISGVKTVPYNGVVKVRCNTPSYYVVDGIPSETFTCSEFSSFKKRSQCSVSTCQVQHRGHQT